MLLAEITGAIGDYTKDCILITRAEPFDAPDGPEIVWCNKAFTEATGYTLEEIKGKTPRIFQGPDTESAPLAEIRVALETWKPVVTVVKNYTKAGEAYYAELSIVPVADSSGWFRYWVSVQRDVTHRVEFERHLKERNRVLRESERELQEEKVQLSGIAAVAQHAKDLITITDLEFRILWANPAFIKRTGYSAAAVRGSSHCDLVSKRGEVYASRDMAMQAILKGAFQDGEVRNIDRNGDEYWTDVHISAQRDDFGRPERFVVVEREITEQRRQRLDLERSRKDISIASVRDPLTGMLNRRGFEEALDHMIRQAGRLGHGVGLLHIDLDYFKQINDTLGHAAGDAVLKSVAERLQTHLGPDSFAARIGGDEFVVAVELHDTDQDLTLFSQRLLKDLSRPVRYEHADCRFGASIGYSKRIEAPFSVDALLIEADIALYRAKADGRNTVHAFTEELANQTKRKKTLADQLTVALENGDLSTFYQPQFDAKSGKMVGAEALVRWDHPDDGLVGPDQFLSLARELNLEPLIDRQILTLVLADAKVMREAGVPLPRVSVNVSARRLRHPSLIEELDRLTIPPGTISFELLESTFLDDNDPKVLWTLDCIRERKIDIEIDDFGTGHASIMGLLKVAPDRLKTDKSLLTPALLDLRRQQLLGIVVQIGKVLDIEVTAEGVETEAHAQLARDLGCRVLQGFHFAHPMTREDLIAKFSGEADLRFGT